MERVLLSFWSSTGCVYIIRARIDVAAALRSGYLASDAALTLCAEKWYQYTHSHKGCGDLVHSLLGLRLAHAHGSHLPYRTRQAGTPTR